MPAQRRGMSAEMADAEQQNTQAMCVPPASPTACRPLVLSGASVRHYRAGAGCSPAPEPCSALCLLPHAAVQSWPPCLYTGPWLHFQLSVRPADGCQRSASGSARRPGLVLPLPHGCSTVLHSTGTNPFPSQRSRDLLCCVQTLTQLVLQYSGC